MKKAIYILGITTAITGCVSNSSSLENSNKYSSNEISRKVIERLAIQDSNEELRLMLVEFPPGISSVPHTHPVGGLCYVIEGVAESQYEGEDLKTFHAGESYQDIPTKKHLLFRNSSKNNPLKFACAAKINKEEQFMIPI